MPRPPHDAGTGAMSLPIEDVDALRRVLDGISNPVFVKDEHRRFVALNRAMCELMGRKHEDLIGRTDEDLIPAEQAEVFRLRDNLVLETGQVDRNEELLTAEEGIERTLVTHKRKVTLASGAPLIVGCISDITELKEREAGLRLLFENNPLPMWVFDLETLRFLAVNGAAVDHYGYSREEFLSKSILEIRPAEDAEPFRRVALRNLVANREGRYWRHIKADGSLIDVVAYSQALEFEGRRAAIVAVVDISERKRAEDELRRTQDFLDTIVENIPSILFAKEEKEQRYILINRAGEKLLGRSREEVIGKTDYDLLPKEAADAFVQRGKEVLRLDGVPLVSEERIQTPDGEWRDFLTRRISVRSRDGGSRYVLGVTEDITERKRAEARIAHMADHDALTDLPNRSVFADRLSFMLERSATTAEQFALVSLDLDKFKDINDLYGPMVADSLLREIGHRLSAAAEGAFLARVGGDEFMLISGEGPQPFCAMSLVDRMLAAAADEIDIDGRRLAVGTSIGVAFYPDDGDDAVTLMANANAALYRAKGEGGGVVRVFEARMDQQLRERRSLQEDLRSALARRELLLHYQPQALVSGAIVGFEALVRWQHPQRGMVSPAEFIPIAEQSGLILPIGEWVLREACREAASWPNPLQIAVNLSPAQFHHGDLAGMVHAVLMETGLAPERLELEITENVLIHDFSRATSILRRLKALGVKIAMDDFGTGYSSLSYLQSFPFDKIKIDQAFVSMIRKKPQSAAIIRAIVGLGRGLSMDIVAEGVETAAQLEYLREEDCNEVQGFYVGRPMPIERYAAEVGRRAKRASAGGADKGSASN